MSKEQKRLLITEHAPGRTEGIPELVASQDITVSLVKLNEGEALLAPSEYDAVISGGGPMGTYEMYKPEYDFLKREADFLAEMISQGKAVLGICLGHQLLAHVLGGEVEKSLPHKEVGWSKITVNHFGAQDPLFAKMPSIFWTFQYHGDAVLRLPVGATNLAESNKCAIQAFRFSRQPVWGVQFHPEISPEKAQRILESRKESLEQEGLDIFLAISQGFKVDHNPRQQIFYNFLDILQKI